MSASHRSDAVPRVDKSGYLVTGDGMKDRDLRRLITAVVEDRWAEEVRRWASGEYAFLRSKAVLRNEVAHEYLALAEALGPWAYADSDEFFPLNGDHPLSEFGFFD